MTSSTAVDLTTNQSTSRTTDSYTKPTAIATRLGSIETSSEQTSDHAALNASLDV